MDTLRTNRGGTLIKTRIEINILPSDKTNLFLFGDTA